jgi:hypothetical protein
MAVPNRYNGGGYLQGVVIDAVIDGSGAPAPASTGIPVKGVSYTFLGYQQITAATLAASTALTVPAGATTAIVQNNTNQVVRFRTDGATTAPTATLGMRIAVAGTATRDIGNSSLLTSRFIVEAAATGTLDIEYFS